MRWILYFFGGGWAFFLGALLVAVAVVMFARNRGGLPAMVTAVLGGLLVLLSGTPLPGWLFAVVVISFVAWLVSERAQSPKLVWQRPFRRGILLAIGCLALGWELPHQVSPHVSVRGGPTLYVLGDSVTAGGSDGEKDRWPDLLRAEQRIEVVDLAQMGATTASALKRAEQIPPEATLILLEIGGNDLLGSTTTAEYEVATENLLAKICSPGRDVLMFELPLPPFRNDYGVAQRRLAAKHGAKLIPKRLFMHVLTGADATTDSVHLTPAGHRRMADVVWNLIRPAYRE